MMKHSELRSTCNRSVTEVPDVRNFWDDPEACDHAVFFIAVKPSFGDWFRAVGLRLGIGPTNC